MAGVSGQAATPLLPPQSDPPSLSEPLVKLNATGAQNALSWLHNSVNALMSTVEALNKRHELAEKELREEQRLLRGQFASLATRSDRAESNLSGLTAKRIDTAGSGESPRGTSAESPGVTLQAPSELGGAIPFSPVSIGRLSGKFPSVDFGSTGGGASDLQAAMLIADVEDLKSRTLALDDTLVHHREQQLHHHKAESDLITMRLDTIELELEARLRPGDVEKQRLEMEQRLARLEKELPETIQSLSRDLRSEVGQGREQLRLDLKKIIDALYAKLHLADENINSKLAMLDQQGIAMGSIASSGGGNAASDGVGLGVREADCFLPTSPKSDKGVSSAAMRALMEEVEGALGRRIDELAVRLESEKAPAQAAPRGVLAANGSEEFPLTQHDAQEEGGGGKDDSQATALVHRLEEEERARIAQADLLEREIQELAEGQRNIRNAIEAATGRGGWETVDEGVGFGTIGVETVDAGVDTVSSPTGLTTLEGAAPNGEGAASAAAEKRDGSSSPSSPSAATRRLGESGQLQSTGQRPSTAGMAEITRIAMEGLVAERVRDMEARLRSFAEQLSAVQSHVGTDKAAAAAAVAASPPGDAAEEVVSGSSSSAAAAAASAAATAAAATLGASLASVEQRLEDLASQVQQLRAGAPGASEERGLRLDADAAAAASGSDRLSAVESRLQELLAGAGGGGGGEDGGGGGGGTSAPAAVVTDVLERLARVESRLEGVRAGGVATSAEAAGGGREGGGGEIGGPPEGLLANLSARMDELTGDLASLRVEVAQLPAISGGSRPGTPGMLGQLSEIAEEAGKMTSEMQGKLDELAADVCILRDQRIKRLEEDVKDLEDALDKMPAHDQVPTESPDSPQSADNGGFAGEDFQRALEEQDKRGEARLAAAWQELAGHADSASSRADVVEQGLTKRLERLELTARKASGDDSTLTPAHIAWLEWRISWLEWTCGGVKHSFARPINAEFAPPKPAPYTPAATGFNKVMTEDCELWARAPGKEQRLRRRMLPLTDAQSNSPPDTADTRQAISGVDSVKPDYWAKTKLQTRSTGKLPKLAS